MLKKRIIFTLLYDDGNFMLSRNFRLQKVGDINWLDKNYNFKNVSYFVDELVVLDITRTQRNIDQFCSDLKKVSQGCFVPIAAGGGIRTIETVSQLFKAGADKVVLNTELYQNNPLIEQIASDYGQQSIVASIDLKANDKDYYSAWSHCGTVQQKGHASEWIQQINTLPIGEIYLNSVDKDGTGQGLDLNMLNTLPEDISKPIILVGGVGNSSHILEGLLHPRVDAVATANLFNFIGNGLEQARNYVLMNNVELPVWDSNFFNSLISKKSIINEG